MVSRLFETLTQAVNALSSEGYKSTEQVDYWTEQIRLASEASLPPLSTSEREAEDAMRSVFESLVDRGGALTRHAGVDRFTLARIRPQLHAELTRRIRANADLIKLNREEAIAKSLRRFRAWATSIPEGGAAEPAKREEKKLLREPLSKLSFRDRRCVIDQTAKLNSAINATIAENGGAIAGQWMSHKHQVGYDGRPAHNARDGSVLLIRDSWAHEAGYVKPGKAGYTDEIEQPAELPYCRCWYSYKYSLRSLPPDMLTVKGREALSKARAAAAA